MTTRLPNLAAPPRRDRISGSLAKLSEITLMATSRCTEVAGAEDLAHSADSD